MRKTIFLITIIVSFFALNTNAQETNEVTKYALIVVGTSDGEKGESLKDTIDKNCFWLSGVSNYIALQKLGFKPENIRFIYDNGRPDFTETKYSETIQFLKKNQFRKIMEQRKATAENLMKTILEFSKKVDDNDIFVLSINTHGWYNYLSIEDGDLSSAQLSERLKYINPGFGLVFIDACMSGIFIEDMEVQKNFVIISSSDQGVTWGDRNYSTSSVFFENFTETENDLDGDGYISVIEAYSQIKTKAQEYWEKTLPVLKKTYDGDRDNLDAVTFNPQIKFWRGNNINNFNINK